MILARYSTAHSNFPPVLRSASADPLSWGPILALCITVDHKPFHLSGCPRVIRSVHWSLIDDCFDGLYGSFSTKGFPPVYYRDLASRAWACNFLAAKILLKLEFSKLTPRSLSLMRLAIQFAPLYLTLFSTQISALSPIKYSIHILIRDVYKDDVYLPLSWLLTRIERIGTRLNSLTFSTNSVVFVVYQL